MKWKIVKVTWLLIGLYLLLLAIDYLPLNMLWVQGTVFYAMDDNGAETVDLRCGITGYREGTKKAFVIVKICGRNVKYKAESKYVQASKFHLGSTVWAHAHFGVFSQHIYSIWYVKEPGQDWR